MTTRLIQNFKLSLIGLIFLLILGCTTTSFNPAENPTTEIQEIETYTLPSNENIKINIENTTLVGNIPKSTGPVRIEINENLETQNSGINSIQVESSEESTESIVDFNSDETVITDSNTESIMATDSNVNSNEFEDENSGNVQEQNQAQENNTESSPLENSNPATPPSNVFSDDFSQGLNNWHIEFTGYGNIWIDQEILNMKPQIALSPAENHAPLMTSNSSWSNFILDFDQKTIQQLRQNSPPDPWEVAWIMFRYTDLENYYYFIFKTNGVQLAKKQGSLNEIFLQTPNNPRVQIGQWNHIKVQAQGNHIQVWADNQLVIDYTDSDPLSAGKIGLYNEESWTQFDNIRVQPI
ncbi:MAG: DUF1080 domain-containing protein [Candidatus Diapherotrites archaeon]|nr:DUF1080 domain-containing protein [Candidatus Diapherotrites archaeon]